MRSCGSGVPNPLSRVLARRGRDTGTGKEGEEEGGGGWGASSVTGREATRSQGETEGPAPSARGGTQLLPQLGEGSQPPDRESTVCGEPLACPLARVLVIVFEIDQLIPVLLQKRAGGPLDLPGPWLGLSWPCPLTPGWPWPSSDRRPIAVSLGQSLCPPGSPPPGRGERSADSHTGVFVQNPKCHAGPGSPGCRLQRGGNGRELNCPLGPTPRVGGLSSLTGS